MTRRGDFRLYALGLAALAVLALLSALIVPVGTDIPALSIRSADADGSMALQRWFEASGFEVREVTSLADQLEAIDVLFVLNPIMPYAPEDALLIHNWVVRGNMVVVGGFPRLTNPLLDPFDARLHFLRFSQADVSPDAPLLIDPPYDDARAEPVFGIITERADAVPHLFTAGEPALMTWQEGSGRIWVTGALRPFTNRGLHDEGNAKLLANLLAGHRPEFTVVGFDEAAHGFGEATQHTLSAWLFGTEPGWGIVTAVVLTLGFVALRGRRFGRAVPLPGEGQRRDMREYIQAMATLFRRSGQRGEIVAHYEQQLRRRLSERYSVDPKLDSAELVKAIVYRAPNVDEAALRATLERLSKRNLSEAELIAAALEVDGWLRSLT